jgi:hypothetical protein
LFTLSKYPTFSLAIPIHRHHIARSKRLVLPTDFPRYLPNDALFVGPEKVGDKISPADVRYGSDFHILNVEHDQLGLCDIVGIKKSGREVIALRADLYVLVCGVGGKSFERNEVSLNALHTCGGFGTQSNMG